MSDLAKNFSRVDILNSSEEPAPAEYTVGAKNRRVSLRENMYESGELSVAAVIPLYNGAPFIEEALLSVLTQTDPADEIIVVDDGSTDDGPEIVRRMAAEHPIQLLRKHNGGQSSARNLGISLSKCSHMALLDQDDLWYEDHLELLKRPFTERSTHNLGVVYGNVDRIDLVGRMIARNFLDSISSPQPKMSLSQCLSEDMYILPGATLINKSAFVKIGAFDERLSGYEDDDLFVRMFSAGFRFEYLKRPVLRWRMNPSSSSYSARMAVSRMTYFEKLTTSYPDEARLNLFWTRDIVAPRFFHICFCEFVHGSRLGDRARAIRAWSDLKQIAPFMSKRVRRNISVLQPVIDRLCGSPFLDLARPLLRFAARTGLKTRRHMRVLGKSSFAF